MIKTILFDFGDVFLNLDKRAPERQLSNLTSFTNLEKIKHINLDYEQGFIDSDEFLSHYRNQFPELANSEVKKIWNSMLIDFPKYRLDFIEQLAEKNKFKLILLSNTNDWHIAWVQENFKDYKRFENCFDAFYLSHEMGMRKPNPEIFDYVLNQHNLNAEETLFIDDTSQNTKAAGEIGMHTWNIDPKTEDVIELFSQKSKLF